MATAAGFSICLFVPSGEPDGLRIVEKSNWTGQGLVFPRSDFAEVRQRPELKRAGVYVLWGPEESGRLPRVYVGEGDVVLPRLTQHAKSKDFWTQAAVFTSKDQNLNKAHVQYLEFRLVALATEAKRCELDNGNVPQEPALSEADAAESEAFLNDLLLCLRAVGVDHFDKPPAAASSGDELFLSSKGIEARGLDSAQGFIVRAGATAVREELPSIHTYLSDLRRTLAEKGVLAADGDLLRLSQDYTFNSPSTAAGVLVGRPANGRVEWKDAKGKSLKEIQEEAAGDS